jgi:hypothetical protein
MEGYDDSLFLDEEVVYSSATYRIDAVRLLGKVLNAIKSNPMDPAALELADTHLTNWALHLPDEKRKPIDRDQHVDEVLFTAHMIAAAYGSLPLLSALRLTMRQMFHPAP